MTAYQALGPFISTFADSNITALLHNDNGEIVITDRELLAQRLEDLEKAAEETSTTTVTVKVNNPEEQVESMLLDTEAEARNDKTEAAETSASEESKESSGIVEDKSDNSLDCDDATENNTEGQHVINMDIEEDDAEDHRQMSPEATSPSPTSPLSVQQPLQQQPEVNNKEEDKHLRKIVHSKSLDDLSPEENRAKQYESSQVTANNTGKDAAVAGSQLTSSESYNNFLYWRDPLPVLDDLDDLKTSEDAAAASATVNETVKTASTAEEETASTTLDNAGEKKGM